MNRLVNFQLQLSEVIFLMHLLDIWSQFREELVAKHPDSEDAEHYEFEAEFAKVVLDKISEAAILESERALLERCFELEKA